ncbi:MAG: glycosyl hydrolase [Opitutae bacterium]
MKRLLIVLLVLLFVSCRKTPNVKIDDLIPEPTPEMRTAVTSPSYTYFFPIIISDSRPTQQGLAKAYGAVTASDVDRLNIEWYYDYGLRYPSPVLGDAEYIPFFWCDQYPALKWPTQYNYFDSLAKLPDDYNGYLLFLNEPDLRGGDVDGWQCDRTPRQAAYIYKALLAECPNCIFIGPATSHIDYLQGWPWLREFYETIYKMGLKPPQIAAAHDYTEQSGSELVNSLFRLLDLFPGAAKKVWITEFATCDPNLARKSIEFYQSDERVERYAWFTGKGYPASPCINLINSTGVLQPVGDVYQQAYP